MQLIKVCLGVLTALAVALPAHALTPGKGSVRAFVFYPNGAPVPDAVVQLENKTMGKTDPDGMAYFELDPGEYAFEIRPKGLTDLKTAIVPVLEGQETEFLVVYKAADVPEVLLEAPQTSLASGEEEDAVKGKVSGVVVSQEKKQPIEGARVFVRGSRVDARSDAEGKFTIELPVGIRELTIIHPNFATQTVPGIEVKADETVEVTAELEDRAVRVAEFVVTAPRIEGGAVFVLQERKASSSVTDVLGADQISKAGDSDAASALARVTGVTVIDGRFVYVRGLGERYSNTLLNDSALPSPDPEKRVVPLDLFPAGIISALEVQKTYSPDVAGEFGGGLVKVRTRDIPDEFSLKIGFSGSYVDGSTFETARSYQGGQLDYLGFGTPERDFASRVGDALDGRILRADSGFSVDELERLGEELNFNFPLQNTQLIPDMGLSFEVGGSAELSDNVVWGVLAGVDWGQDWRAFEGERNNYQVSTNDSLEQRVDYDFERTKREVTLTGVLTTGLDIGNDHELRYTGTVNRISEDETAFVFGFQTERDRDVEITRLRWQEQMLSTHQIRGKHDISDNAVNLNWRYMFSLATREEPNRRQAQYNINPRNGQIPIDADNYQRFDSSLEDFTHDIGLNVGVPFKLFGDAETKIQGGFAAELKDRTVSTRRFSFDESSSLTTTYIRNRPIESQFADDIVGDTFWLPEEVTLPSDNYDADQKIFAGYVMTDLGIPVGEGIKILVGARFEDWQLSVSTRDTNQAPGSGEVASEKREFVILPSLTATYEFIEDMQVRLSVAQTVNRPNFREVTPAQFRDVTTAVVVEGNPDVDPAKIIHGDIRWEWYPAPGESVSVAAFVKSFTDPIEFTAQGGANLVFRPENVDSAINYGGEFEFRKNFGFIWDPLEDLYIAGNLALIESRVSISEQQAMVLTERSRPLQGQSPYSVNAQIGYDNLDTDTSVSLLFNVFGRRIIQVGTQNLPDIYEEPVPRLDFVISQRLGRFKIGFKAKNLLDPNLDLTQTERGDDNEVLIVERYQRGRQFSLGISVDLD